MASRQEDHRLASTTKIRSSSTGTTAEEARSTVSYMKGAMEKLLDEDYLKLAYLTGYGRSIAWLQPGLRRAASLRSVRYR
ncbi:MAG: hypothetical protein ACLTMP_00985 [Eggerthella lenta]